MASPSRRCCRSTAVSRRLVRTETARSVADLAMLAVHDDDAFARHEAMQHLMVETRAPLRRGMRPIAQR